VSRHKRSGISPRRGRRPAWPFSPTAPSHLLENDPAADYFFISRSKEPSRALVTSLSSRGVSAYRKVAPPLPVHHLAPETEDGPPCSSSERSGVIRGVARCIAARRLPLMRLVGLPEPSPVPCALSVRRGRLVVPATSRLPGPGAGRPNESRRPASLRLLPRSRV
jgi:hypothetical protein